MGEDKITIEICLGSSCHLRGGKEIAEYLKENYSDNPKVILKGCLCRDKCTNGPIIKINNDEYHEVSVFKLPQILSKYNI